MWEWPNVAVIVYMYMHMQRWTYFFHSCIKYMLILQFESFYYNGRWTKTIWSNNDSVFTYSDHIHIHQYLSQLLLFCETIRTRSCDWISLYLRSHISFFLSQVLRKSYDENQTETILNNTSSQFNIMVIENINVSFSFQIHSN